jgi:SAM-dependent methyltransferase
MPDKAKFVSELTRVLAPGGRIIIATWCHRELANGESLSESEQQLLESINDGEFVCIDSLHSFTRLFAQHITCPSGLLAPNTLDC